MSWIKKDEYYLQNTDGHTITKSESGIFKYALYVHAKSLNAIGFYSTSEEAIKTHSELKK